MYGRVKMKRRGTGEKGTRGDPSPLLPYPLALAHRPLMKRVAHKTNKGLKSRLCDTHKVHAGSARVRGTRPM